jgi:hypothetical protein
MVDRLTTQAALEAEELLMMIKPQEARTSAHQPSPIPRPTPGLATSVTSPERP